MQQEIACVCTHYTKQKVTNKQIHYCINFKLQPSDCFHRMVKSQQTVDWQHVCRVIENKLGIWKRQWPEVSLVAITQSYNLFLWMDITVSIMSRDIVLI